LLDAAKGEPAWKEVKEKEVDIFLQEKVLEHQADLWPTISKLLLLSHGQATVERGFSINREVETVNMKSDTIVAHRQICSHVASVGGLGEVVLSKELLQSCSNARSKYRMYLDEQKQKKKEDTERQKRSWLGLKRREKPTWRV
jgi:hypothetical protein